MKCVWSLVIGVFVLVPSLSSAADISALLGTWEMRNMVGEKESLVIFTFDNQVGEMIVTGQTSGGFQVFGARTQDEFDADSLIYAYRMRGAIEGACISVRFNLASLTAGAGILFSSPRIADRCGVIESYFDIAIRAYSPEESEEAAP